MVVKQKNLVENPTEKLWGIIKIKKHVKSPKKKARKAMERSVKKELNV